MVFDVSQLARGLYGCVLVAVQVAWASSLAAQPPGRTTAVVAVPGTSEALVAAARLAIAERRGEPIEVSEAAAQRQLAEGHIPYRQVMAFVEVESLLAAARRSRLSLQDQQASHHLARAKGIVLNHLAVPGAARWLAEIELQHGIMAAQAGSAALAESALRRALVLDPLRTVRLGEASPAVVALSARVQRALVAAPTGFVSVSTRGVEGAAVFLDDRSVGTAPVRFRAKTGRHVIRVEAAGHVPYGWAADVSVGEQRPAEVVLTVEPRLRATQRLSQHVAAGELDEVPDLLRSLGVEELWWLQGSADGRRGLMGACSQFGCRWPERLELTGVSLEASVRRGLAAGTQRLPAAGPAASTVPGLSAARAWLARGSRSEARESSGPEPWVWVAVGVAAAVTAGVVTGLAVSGAGDAPGQLTIEADPCALLGNCTSP